MATKGTRRVVVIGGGAGGLMAALTAGQCGAEVTVLEMANRVGKKLLKTGNGRCNLSNTHVSPEGYNCPGFVKTVLTATDCAVLCGHFASLGLWTTEDGEGRVYPRSDTASSVLDVLRLACAENGVREVCSAEVTAIRPAPDGTFRIQTRDGGQYTAERVIAATGGGTALLRSLGHRLVPFSPVLCPIKTDTVSIRGLSGLRVKCRARLYNGQTLLADERGEILFRDFGVSGILALDLSRFLAPGAVLSLDLLPETDENELVSRLAGRRGGAERLTGIFHRRVAEALMREAKGDDPAALAHRIKDYRMTVLGCGDTQNAQVTRGGADTAQFDPATLQSRLCPGVYAIGEALDVDGRCGGYNLHWAFASGIAAGRSAALD